MEKRERIRLFVCDPAKNTTCRASACWFKKRGECRFTTKEEFAMTDPETGEKIFAEEIRKVEKKRK